MSTYGNKLKMTIYGESHQKEMGVVISGVPAGILVDHDLIKENLARRRPQTTYETKRIESDNYRITSGVFEKCTTGAPLNIVIENTQAASENYNKDFFRPGSIDYIASEKYAGYNDYRGGGSFSGRLTSLIVIAGSIAMMIKKYDISSQLIKLHKSSKEEEYEDILSKALLEGDSVGGIIRLTAKNVEKGLGSPYFGRINCLISSMLLSIPGTKGITFGDYLDASDYFGSEVNDCYVDKNGSTLTNHAGGVNGGITNGNDLIVNVIVRPPSSISKEQLSFSNKTSKIETLKIIGRHDVAFVRRCLVVLECALAFVLCDAHLTK